MLQLCHKYLGRLQLCHKYGEDYLVEGYQKFSQVVAQFPQGTVASHAQDMASIEDTIKLLKAVVTMNKSYIKY